MTRVGTTAFLAVLAACSAAAAQVSVSASRRLPDGRTATIGTINTEDPREELRREQALCARMIAAAEAAIARQRWPAALENLEAAQEHSPSPAQFQRLRQLYESAEAAGQRALKAADDLLRQEKYAQALDAYAAVQRDFIPLPSGQKGREAVARLRADPAARAALQQARALRLLAQIEAILAAELGSAEPAPATRPAAPASRLLRIKDLSEASQDKAFPLLETLARECSACAEGQRGARDLAALKADASFYDSLLSRRQARQGQAMLDLARDLRKGNRLDRAAFFYRKILKEFPLAPAAKVARRELAEVEELLADPKK